MINPEEDRKEQLGQRSSGKNRKWQDNMSVDSWHIIYITEYTTIKK